MSTLTSFSRAMTNSEIREEPLRVPCSLDTLVAGLWTGRREVAASSKLSLSGYDWSCVLRPSNSRLHEHQYLTRRASKSKPTRGLARRRKKRS